MGSMHAETRITVEISQQPGDGRRRGRCKGPGRALLSVPVVGVGIGEFQLDRIVEIPVPVA